MARSLEVPCWTEQGKLVASELQEQESLLRHRHRKDSAQSPAELLIYPELQLVSAVAIA